MPVEEVGGTGDSLGSVPVLADDHHQLASRDGWTGDLFEDMIWHTLVVVVELMLLAVVDAVEIVLAEPLAPALEMQLAVDLGLMTLLGGVADEDEMGFVAQAR